jgi:hypothetical protein
MQMKLKFELLSVIAARPIPRGNFHNGGLSPAKLLQLPFVPRLPLFLNTFGVFRLWV